METWMLYAILSMIFAGVTAIFAKYGLENISADLGLVIRTFIIFILVLGLGFWSSSYSEISNLSLKQVILLIASGITAFLSWVFYFRAIKDGPVSYVVSIDKASIVITLLLSFILLREPVKPQVLVGAGLIFAGMLVLIWK